VFFVLIGRRRKSNTCSSAKFRRQIAKWQDLIAKKNAQVDQPLKEKPDHLI
jgi:hypothetical protein